MNFLENEEVVKSILNDLKISLLLPEDKIIRQGDVAEWMYFLAKGEWDVYVTDENQVEKYTKTLKGGSYFGEVALLKNCKRTASVISKNYSTCARLDKSSFFRLIERYQFVKDSMLEHMREEYQDKWKKFIKRCIRNIDYLSFGISDKIVEELTYLFELTSLKEENYLFQAGQPCKDIYIINNGELNIYVHNNTKETYLESLYTGWSIGAYSSLTQEPFTLSGKAKTDLTLLKLPFNKMLELREKFEDLDKVMTEYENYIEEYGLPYCDYKIFRNKETNITPIEKLRSGVKRVLRIIRSYKSSAFADLMEKIRSKIKEKKNNRESRRRSAIMRNVPLTPEERTQQILIDLGKYILQY